MPLKTDTSAAFSLTNGVFQFAVLSMTINTFGVSAVLGGTPTNRSMSSARLFATCAKNTSSTATH